MSGAMNRVIMFMAVLTVALVLGGYRAQANTQVRKPVTKAWHVPNAWFVTIDAEDTDTLPSYVFFLPVSAMHDHATGAPILETRRAACYPLPMFIVQHRLLI
jgi:hypothetical protein